MKSAVVAVGTRPRKSDRSGKGSKRKATEMDDDSGDEVDVGKKKKKGGSSKVTKEYSREYWVMMMKNKEAVATATGGNENGEDDEEEATSSFPQYLQNAEIDGVLVSSFTEDDIKKMPVDTVGCLNQIQLRACLKVIGGRSGGGNSIEGFRDELIKWKETGYGKFVATNRIYLV
jgi:hypothetical protein